MLKYLFLFCYNRYDLTNYNSLYLPDFKMFQSYLDLKGKNPSLNLHIDTFCFLVTCPSLTGNEEQDWVLISNRNELFSYSNKTWLEQKWILKEVAVCDIVSFIFILFIFIIFIIRRMLWVLWLIYFFWVVNRFKNNFFLSVELKFSTTILFNPSSKL